MRLGVHLVRYDAPGGAGALAPLLAGLGRAVDDAGVDVLSCMDHYLQLPYVGRAEDPMLEGYTTLGFLAAHTARADLQLLVTGVTYRHPGLLAKIVSTLDVLSSGRAVLGIGAAWYEREHQAYGVPFPPLRDRFELLEEALQVVRQMWSEDDGPYEGRHFRLAETICSPRPLRRVPVMVGGVGERKSLRLVAAYADACNIFAGGEQGAAWVRGKLDVLREHCAREGTSYDAIRKTILWTPEVDPGDPAPFLEHMRAMADVGVEEVHVMPVGHRPAEFVRGLGDAVVPVLRGL
jgi:F420-dependent oxidoreductase-like protein